MRQFNLLHVDDDLNDALFLRRALEKAGLPVFYRHLTSGASAMAYLSGQAPFNDRTRYVYPDLMALDLKMPGMSGFEVLGWIQEQTGLPNFHVAVLSSSDQLEDRIQAFQYGAKAFFTKSLAFKELIDAITMILPHRGFGTFPRRTTPAPAYASCFAA
jgi:CheY-like chemotaxis protein